MQVWGEVIQAIMYVMNVIQHLKYMIEICQEIMIIMANPENILN